MSRLSFLVLLFFAINSHGQEFFSRICKQYDTTTYSNAFTGYCGPVQRLTDGSYLTSNLRGYSASESIEYFGQELIKTDTAFRPQFMLTSGSYFNVALTDGTIGAVSNENADTIVSGISFRKIGTDGNILSSKIIHSDDCHFFINAVAAAPAGVKMLSVENHASSFGYIPVAPFLIDLDNNGYVISADSIHINGVDPMYLWPTSIDVNDAGNGVMVINQFLGTQMVYVSSLLADNSVLWANQLYSPYPIEHYASVQLPDGSVILGTSIKFHIDSARSILLKFSPSGALQWQKVSSIGSGITSLKLLPNGNILLVNGLNAGNFCGWIPHGGNMITEMDTAGHVMWSNAFKRPITGAQYTALGTPYIKSANEWYFIANTTAPYLVNLFNTDSNGHGICERDNINYSFVDTSIILVTPAVLTLSPVHVYEVYSSTAVGTSPQEYNDGCVYDYIPPPLSVAISSNDASVVLFPNPAFDKMNIKMPVGETIKEVMVNDMSGRQWLHVHPNSNESIDVTVLPSGCYTVMIVTDSQNIRYSKLTIVH